MLSSLFLSLSFLVSTTDSTFQTYVPAPYSGPTLPAGIGHKLTKAELAAIAAGQPSPPYHSLSAGVRLEDGRLWIATAGGLITRAPNDSRWRLYHSRRWLPADAATDVSVDKDGSVYVLTTAGIGRLEPRQVSLSEKIDAIHAQLRKHHLRDGLVTHVVVNKPGDLASGYTKPDNDNDGLWTSLYVAAEAFRFGVTGDAAARDNAWHSLQALMFLEEVSGIPGFAARSFVPSSQPKPTHGEWYKSADGKWWWKSDTSSDEVIGHYFAHSIYYDLAATEEQKQAIRKVVGRITDHILDHGYYYVGPTGKPTTWGVWAAEKLNRDFRRIGDRGLNSLEILDFLAAAHHITGNDRYRQAARELVDKHGYAANTIVQKAVWPPFVNHSDDELAFLSYYPLMRYEHDAEIRTYLLASLERSWRIEQPEKSPLFNFIYAAGLQATTWKEPAKRPTESTIDPKRYDQRECITWFQEVPSDLFEWTVINSNREDLGEIKNNRHRRSSMTEFVLPVAERPLMRWNGDPYQLDGGNAGKIRDDGTFILLPYWMGRYHRFLE